MVSITKTKISEEQITELVKEAFGTNIVVDKITELTDGCFNSAYLIAFSNGSKAILKIAPKKDIKVMRHEKNLMLSEVYTLNAIKALGEIPVPKVLYYSEDNGNTTENEYFFMEFLNGVPLNKIDSDLTKDQRDSISGVLGKYVNKLHTIKGKYFGYIGDENRQFNTWADAFLFMIKEILDDAKDENVKYPYEYNEMYSMIEQNKDILNQVSASSLLHKDLWQGNIFVQPENNKIIGIIDCERSIYGDPLLETVCGFLSENEAFLTNYIGRTKFTLEEQIRIVLYKIYLFLIMTNETYYRKYEDKGNEMWARTQLDSAFAELIKLSSR